MGKFRHSVANQQWRYSDISEFLGNLKFLYLLLSPTKLGTQRRQWHPTPVLLPRKSHGLRSLVGFSPWGREESDTTERLRFHFLLSCVGEGNGNPLQCSCLENPRDWGAWWAAIYGVAQSRTWLKRLSSSKLGTNDCEHFLFSLSLFEVSIAPWLLAD